MKKTCVVVLALFAVVAMCEIAYADCHDAKMLCIKIIDGNIYNDGKAVKEGEFMTGQCWKSWMCEYCRSWEDLARQCTSTFPTDCGL